MWSSFEWCSSELTKSDGICEIKVRFSIDIEILLLCLNNGTINELDGVWTSSGWDFQPQSGVHKIEICLDVGLRRVFNDRVRSPGIVRSDIQ